MFESLAGFVEVAGSFILVLFPLIIVHEIGHFLAARWFGIGTPVFSVGIGPKIFGIRRGGTDYRLSAIPLGGYVRLKGDEADEHRTGASDEFLARPRGQRFVVFLAGPAVNIVVALAVVWLLAWVWGRDQIHQPPGAYPVVVSVPADSPAYQSGIRLGDRLLAIGGEDPRDEETYIREVQLRPDQPVEVEIERDGRRMTLSLQAGSDSRYRLGDPGWATSRQTEDPARVGHVFEGPAQRAGVKAGDLIVGAAGREPISLVDLRLLLAASPGKEIPLRVERDGKRLELEVRPEERDGEGKVGLGLSPSRIDHIEFGPLAAMRESLAVNLRLSRTLFTVLGSLLRGNISPRAFSGPIEIAQVAEQAVRRGLESVLMIVAFFSLQLGILNLMPIPVLDGGHILILAVEAGWRRELSERVKERVMLAGLALLLAFFAVVIFFDIDKAGLL